MKLLPRVALPLLCLLLLTSSGSAQQLGCIQPGSVPVDTVTMVKSVVTTLSTDLLFKKTATHQIIYEVIVMRTSTGQTDLVVDINSIRFSGSGVGVDIMTSDQLFSLIGTNTVQNGLNSGIINCSGLLGGQTVRVIQAGCAERVGSGLATHYMPCTTECCIKRYTVQCLLGIPVISLMSSDGPNCSAGSPSSPCRSTCGNGGGLVLLPSLSL